MDPTSFVASVLTLLGAAGASCEFIYNFILDISELPDEIHSQARKLQCLKQSLSNLMKIYEQNATPAELHLDPYLGEQLRRFLAETGKIEMKLRASSFRLDQSRTQHIRERVYWISSNRRMRKFYNTLDDWLKIFSTTAITTQISLLVKIHQQTADMRSGLPLEQSKHLSSVGWEEPFHERVYDRSSMQSQIQHASLELPVRQSFATAPQKPDFTRRLSSYLASQMEPIGYRIKCWLNASFPQWSIDLRFGPSVVRTWTKEGGITYRTLCWKEGISFKATVCIHMFSPTRFAFTVSSITKVSAIHTICNLNMRRILDIRSAPYIACSKGDWKLLRDLIQNKQVGISDVTTYGSTLLHIAARENHLEVVVGLLQEGAKADAENDFGQTPLQECVESNCDYGIISQLLSHDADLYHQDITGRTPLHVYFNVAVQSLIHFHYTDIDNTSQDSRGMTISQYVAWTNRSSREDLIRCCNEVLASLRIANEEGKRPLHFACQRGNMDLVNYLLDLEENDISVRDHLGRTLLHYAIESSRSMHVIELLLQKGADLETRDICGRTAMHYAALEGNLCAVQKLIEAGAVSHIYELDDTSKKPLDLAISKGNLEVVEYLRENYHGYSDETSSIISTPATRKVYEDDIKKDLTSVLWILFSLTIIFILLS